MSLRGTERADHVGGIAGEEIGYRMAAARHGISGLRIQRGRVAGGKCEAPTNAVVGVEEYARLADVETKLNAMPPAHKRHAVGNVVVVQDAALQVDESPFEAGLLQGLDRLGAADAALAVDHGGA